MASRAYSPPNLYSALKEEGFILPDEIADISIELPVDGPAQLIIRINVFGEKLAQVGRALERIGKSTK